MDHSKKKKYYIILAVNLNDPEDIIGFVEHSFRMGWEKGRVVVWEAEHERGDDEFRGIPVKKALEKKLQGSHYGLSNEVKFKGRKTMLRKQMANPASEEFSCCGRTHTEYMWNWVRHYSMWCGQDLRKKGYEIRPYRVGSKFCPVELDFSERTAMEKKQIPWNKYNWRNVPYKIKKAN